MPSYDGFASFLITINCSIAGCLFYKALLSKELLISKAILFFPVMTRDQKTKIIFFAHALISCTGFVYIWNSNNILIKFSSNLKSNAPTNVISFHLWQARYSFQGKVTLQWLQNSSLLITPSAAAHISRKSSSSNHWTRCLFLSIMNLTAIDNCLPCALSCYR